MSPPRPFAHPPPRPRDRGKKRHLIDVDEGVEERLVEVDVAPGGPGSLRGVGTLFWPFTSLNWTTVGIGTKTQDLDK